MSVVREFRRRNVFRVGVAYLVAAWLIVQVADTLFSLFGFGERPAQVVVILLAIGIVPTLVLAWAFRLTPEGLRKESELDTPVSAGAGKRLDRIIMIVLALALAVFAIDQFLLDPWRDARREADVAQKVEEARLQGRTEALIESYGSNSIAVLPFVNLSDDAGNEFFSDGVSEELLNLLARIPDLRVISRTSAFSYKGKDIKLAQIAAELDVAFILEGSVRKAGNRVRITAQLIDARSDTQVWSEAFDRELDDIFAIQSEIAATVTERLKLSLLGGAPRPRTTNADAYALYLQARYQTHQNTAESYQQAIELLGRVLEIDANYLPAWDALAVTYANQAARGLRPANEGFNLARDAAESALAIDTNFAPAYARLGRVALLFDGNLALAARHYQKALQLAPGNISAIGDAATLLQSLGRMDQSVAFDEYVVARDPVNPVGHYNLGAGYLYAGRYDDAIASLETALQFSPRRIGGNYLLGKALLLKGESAQVLATMEKESLDVLRQLGRVIGHDAAGNADFADQLLNELIANHEQDAAYNIAYVHAWRGLADAAFSWLQKAVAYGDPGLADVAVEPLFSPIRSDPRWLPFLESVGKAPAQLDAIVFDVRLPGDSG